jgi:hypothetical protein
MENLNSVLLLDRCVLTNLHIESNVESEPTNPKDAVNKVEIKREVRKYLSEPKFIVDAVFTFTWDKSAFFYNKIEIGLRGVFSFPEGTTEDTIALYVPMLCLTNLYGTARGMIAQATSLCPGGPFLLPLLDMNKIVQDSTPDTLPMPKVKSKKRAIKKEIEE